jgi:cysteine-rich repeat protein
VTEECDDGNTAPDDGCAADCTNETSCSGGACVNSSGDPCGAFGGGGTCTPPEVCIAEISCARPCSVESDCL